MVRECGVAALYLTSGLGFAVDSSPQQESIPTFGTTVVIPSGLRGQVYFINPGTWWLPDFSRLKPVGTIYTTSLNVPPQDWSLGFPGVTSRNEWFAIDYTGRFWIQKAGEYRFSLASDDGSKLYIDDHVVINNDGQHPPQTENGRVTLDCGIHRIRVSYFQGPRTYLALLLAVAGPKEKYRLFSTEEFKPPSNPEDWMCDGRPVPDPDAGPQKLASAIKEPPAFETAALEILNRRPMPRAFDIRSAAFRFQSIGAISETVLSFEFPGASLTAKPEPDRKSHRVHASVLGLVKRADGQIIDTFKWDAPYEIPDTNLAEVRATAITYAHPVSLPSGHYKVETAILDREGNQSSTDVMEIDAPAPRKGVGLSSVILVQRIEPLSGQAAGFDPLVFQGKRVVPLLAKTLTPDAKPYVYFVVYPDKSNAEKPKIQVEFLVGGQLLARQTAELPPPDASGAIQMMVAAATQPGACELRMTALQGSDSVTESIKYTVAPR